MADLSLVKGTTSKLVEFFVEDSSVTTGVGLTGLVFNTSGLTAYYYREGAASATAISLVTMTLGTWASGGFVAVDGTNMPGLYQLGIPNAALATGAKDVTIVLKGATNMKPVRIRLQLDAVDNQNANNFGLAYLPQAPMMVKKNQDFTNFQFLMVSSTDHVTPKTGLTVTAQRSIDGAAFGACANTFAEIGLGMYKIDLAAADVNGGMITFAFSATGADTRFVSLITQA